jgi:hypothetical protein
MSLLSWKLQLKVRKISNVFHIIQHALVYNHLTKNALVRAEPSHLPLSIHPYE